MILSRADLHIHTLYSDGSDSTEQLLTTIRTNQITYFSVTDHDTIDGVMHMQSLDLTGLHFFPGVEFSCFTPYKKCHILGYCYDAACPTFQDVLLEGHDKRMQKLRLRLDYLKEKFGIVFSKQTQDSFYQMTSVGKPHLAKALIALGYGTTIQEVMDKYLTLRTPNDKVEAAKAIAAIRASGGTAVWAHPLGGEGERHLTPEEFTKQLDILLQGGLHGLECYYARYNREEIDFLLQQAHKHHLFISGGSDYHGVNKTISLCELNSFGAPVDSSQLSLLTYLRHQHAAPSKFPNGNRTACAF